MSTARFAIVGAGIGGLTAALALQRQGLRVRVFEQAPTLQEVGAGVMLAPNATRVLRALGLGEAIASAGFRPTFTSVRAGLTGEMLSQVPLGDGGRHADGAPFCHLHRADLHRVLVAAVLDREPGCLELGWALRTLRAQGDVVVAEFDGGRSVECAAVVGADGVKSRVRATVAPEATAQFTGNIAWRGLVPAAGLRPSVRAPEGVIFVGPGRHVVRYAVKEGRFINYVAIAERDVWQEEGWMVRSEVADVLAEFADWHADVRELIAATPPEACFKWGLFDRAPLPAWSAGRITLLGDAAHPMLPFMAQGAAMAIEDAAVLARRVGADPDAARAFAAYEAVRKPRASWVQAQSRRNQRLYHDGAVGRQFDEDRTLRAERLYDYDAFNA